MDPFCEALERLLVKDGQPTPRTLMRIMENLPYSRLTILKHLKEMEMNGLISKSTIARSSRGRPKVLYQPTASLVRGDASSIQIPFSLLSENCIHRDEGRCTKSPGACGLRRCPLIYKNRQ